MMLEEEYCIKWKGFEGNMLESLEELRGDFSDVSISCEEGKSILAHKLILASCSPYFMKIFKENPCRHPVIILNDIPQDILLSLMTYMYQGSVSLSEKRVPLFLKAAKHLKIKGLGSSEEDPAAAPNNLSILASAAALDGQLLNNNNPPLKRNQDYRVPKYSPQPPPPPPPMANNTPTSHLPLQIKEENEENMNEDVCERRRGEGALYSGVTPKPHVPQTTLLTIPDPTNVFISQENRVRETPEGGGHHPRPPPSKPSALDMSNKIPSPPPEEHSNNTSEEVLLPLTSSATSEQMAALLGPSWKSRQPRMCPYCKRMFSNKFNLKQHILNMHTVGRELQCEQCQKKVKNKWYLRRHHVTHHGAPLKK